MLVVLYQEKHFKNWQVIGICIITCSSEWEKICFKQEREYFDVASNFIFYLKEETFQKWGF